MYINDLKIFESVAEHGSFTKAAAINNTVQSNVTGRIKFLEEFFNTKLFVRSTRKIELTDEGLQVLQCAKEIQLSINRTKTSITKLSTPLSGIIKIGCIHTTAAFRTPGILQTFTDQYPDVSFKLKTDVTANLINDVLKFKLDGAFVSGEVNNEALDVQHVFLEDLSIITSTADKKTIFGKPVKLIVFNSGCSYRQRFLEILEEKKMDSYKIIEIDTLEGIINSVEAGIGITLLPTELILKHYGYRSLNLMRLPKKFSKCVTQFIKRKDYPSEEIHQLFFNSIINGYRAVS